jgi:Pyruvate/2-oxoacid:ferredoxin oxidoreductase delta subunit
MMLLKDYYRTDHWRKLRLTITEDKECVCEICGVKRWESYVRDPNKWKKPVRMEIHHKVYHLFKEKREDLLCLCHSCHAYCHDSEMMARTRGGVFAANYQNILLDTAWRFTPQERNRKLK